jgi:hypothetical protein
LEGTEYLTVQRRKHEVSEYIIEADAKEAACKV